MIAGLSALQQFGIGATGSARSGISGGASDAAGATGIPGNSFAAALGDAASSAVSNLQSAESVSMAALQGKAETREVVDAVMSAEQSLQAAIAIRDKIVSSYLEISRMAI